MLLLEQNAHLSLNNNHSLHHWDKITFVNVIHKSILTVTHSVDKRRVLTLFLIFMDSYLRPGRN